MEDNQEENISAPAYKNYNIPRNVDVKGFSLTYKDPPLSGNIYRFRCRKKNCNYFFKIYKENIDKLLQNKDSIKYVEVNEHNDHTFKEN